MLVTLAFPLVLSLASAALVRYDWSAEWINANPDGRHERPVIAINGQWPNPTIRANVGDTVEVHLHNKLNEQVTSIHWHGMHQNATQQMDGPPDVTQCEVVPHDSYTYRFNIDEPGTYWWHSHSPQQYGDGLRGPLVVHDPSNPYGHQIDDEIVISLSDWYHNGMPCLLGPYLETPGAGEPEPYSGLINDGPNATFLVQPDKTYMLRFINMAAFSQFNLTIEGHNMTIIEADGIYTEPTEVQSLYISTAQRYSVLIKTHKTTDRNFGILAQLDWTAFDAVPFALQPNVTYAKPPTLSDTCADPSTLHFRGWLVYDHAKPLPPAPLIDQWNMIDDFSLVPVGTPPLYSPVNHRVELVLEFQESYRQNRADFNNVSWIPQKVPTLYTALSAPDQFVDNSLIYGPLVDPIVVRHNDIVEIFVNNTDNGNHPLHMHGHHLQMIARTGPCKFSSDPGQEFPNSLQDAQSHPMMRDTWLVPGSGTATVRFKADNPGIWLIHCHMEWHVTAGLSAVIIEAPEVLRSEKLKLTTEMVSNCKAQDLLTQGNCAGNTVDWLDVADCPTEPPDMLGSLWRSGDYILPVAEDVTVPVAKWPATVWAVFGSGLLVAGVLFAVRESLRRSALVGDARGTYVALGKEEVGMI